MAEPMNYLQTARQLQQLRERVAGFELVLFGAGGAGQQIVQLLEAVGIPCAFFVDNDPARWQQQVAGRYPIKAPAVLQHQPEQYFILISSGAGTAIRQQLAELGFHDDSQVLLALPPDPLMQGRQIFSALYPDYASALADSSGYQVDSYRVAALNSREALLERLEGGSPVLSADEQQMLLALTWAASALQARPGGRRALRVLDFGGALGEHFLLVRHLLPELPIERWLVCETPFITKAAAQLPQQAVLQFCHTIPEPPATQEKAFDLVIASGSLQFVADPAQSFADLAALAAPFFYISRFPLWPGPVDVVARLDVPPHLFHASYPSWHLSLAQWQPRFQQAHQVRASWLNPEFYYQQEQRIDFYGFLLQRLPTDSQSVRESV